MLALTVLFCTSVKTSKKEKKVKKYFFTVENFQNSNVALEFEHLNLKTFYVFISTSKFTEVKNARFSFMVLLLSNDVELNPGPIDSFCNPTIYVGIIGLHFTML